MPYFLDLQQPDFTSHLALVHSRFSTNTFPSWWGGFLKRSSGVGVFVVFFLPQMCVYFILHSVFMNWFRFSIYSVCTYVRIIPLICCRINKVLYEVRIYLIHNIFDCLLVQNSFVFFFVAVFFLPSFCACVSIWWCYDPSPAFFFFFSPPFFLFCLECINTRACVHACMHACVLAFYCFILTPSPAFFLFVRPIFCLVLCTRACLCVSTPSPAFFLFVRLPCLFGLLSVCLVCMYACVRACLLACVVFVVSAVRVCVRCGAAQEPRPAQPHDVPQRRDQHPAGQQELDARQGRSAALRVLRRRDRQPPPRVLGEHVRLGKLRLGARAERQGGRPRDPGGGWRAKRDEKRAKRKRVSRRGAFAV